MLNPISEMSSSTLVLENEASQVVKQPGNVDNGRRSLSQKSITSILNNSGRLMALNSSGRLIAFCGWHLEAPQLII